MNQLNIVIITLALSTSGLADEPQFKPLETDRRNSLRDKPSQDIYVVNRLPIAYQLADANNGPQGFAGLIVCLETRGHALLPDWAVRDRFHIFRRGDTA